MVCGVSLFIFKRKFMEGKCLGFYVIVGLFLSFCLKKIEKERIILLVD